MQGREGLRRHPSRHYQAETGYQPEWKAQFFEARFHRLIPLIVQQLLIVAFWSDGLIPRWHEYDIAPWAKAIIWLT
jgi:peptidoglycan/LPS O-acetylase OafA/YrhL